MNGDLDIYATPALLFNQQMHVLLPQLTGLNQTWHKFLIRRSSCFIYLITLSRESSCYIKSFRSQPVKG